MKRLPMSSVWTCVPVALNNYSNAGNIRIWLNKGAITPHSIVHTVEILWLDAEHYPSQRAFRGTITLDDYLKLRRQQRDTIEALSRMCATL